MSKTTDMRLSGWVINSNLFEEDFKYSDLIEEKGALSFLIYVILRGKISLTNGYYIEFNDSLLRKIHKNLGRCSKGIPHIKDTILYFGEIGILDNAELKNNILTSFDIQKEWLKAKLSRRAKINVDNLEHWLLVDTLPTPTDDNCSNSIDKCSNSIDKCNIYTDKCGHNNTEHNTTRELVQINKTNNISGNAQSEFTMDSVLEIIYSKHERLKSIINAQEYSENAILYAGYWSNACNDERYMSYSVDADKATLNNDFFINCLFLAEANEILSIFQACYEHQPDIRESVEWYFRGILVKKFRKLAKEYQERFQRGRA